MGKIYRAIAVLLVIGALAQVVEGFAEFFSRIGDIVSPNGHPVNPSTSEMLRRGLFGLASAAPTLLIAAIFFHMETILNAISQSRGSEASRESRDGDE